ncbi:hypothetical protein EJ04DRAFT_197246 [Polyplosphaeria fusca]|uniref:Uncharacterized protein n=1 Tax=Polyplosphaeria fusca TaxID=682080 RepID=A0A9P4R7K6_9PLEO|nr:hypothetical protein EJ04DRAFT_197246 [Polyplosphaeria fusca]
MTSRETTRTRVEKARAAADSDPGGTSRCPRMEKHLQWEKLSNVFPLHYDVSSSFASHTLDLRKGTVEEKGYRLYTGRAPKPGKEANKMLTTTVLLMVTLLVKKIFLRKGAPHILIISKAMPHFALAQSHVCRRASTEYYGRSQPHQAQQASGAEPCPRPGLTQT